MTVATDARSQEGPVISIVTSNNRHGKDCSSHVRNVIMQSFRVRRCAEQFIREGFDVSSICPGGELNYDLRRRKRSVPDGH